MNGWHVSPPRSQQPPSSRARPWVTPPKDPLDRILDIGGKKAMRVMGGAIAMTLFFHGAAAARTALIHAEVIAWTQHIDAVIDHKLHQEVDIETITPQTKKIVEEERREPVHVARLDQQPVAAAKAAQILAKNDDDKVLDFSDNVFTVGNSERFSGGDTMSKGTNDKPPDTHKVEEKGVQQAPPPQIVSVDLSRTATLAGSGEWRCPFPPEADSDSVDEASVIIEVIVGATGKAQSANILQNPGHGFGREAQSCAMRESYVPALDKAGNPVASSKKFRVKFER
jgi:protein TonB